MALVFMDSCEPYTNLLQKYNSVSRAGWWLAVAGGQGRFGGSGIVFSGDWDLQSNLQKIGLPASSTYIFGSAFLWSQATQDRPIIYLMESGTTHVSLYLDNSGLFYVKNAAEGVLATASVLVPASQFVYIEFKVLVHSSAGTVELRINGSTVASATGLNTRNGGSGVINGFQLGYGPNTANGHAFHGTFDDIYLCTGDGGINDDFRGDCKVECLFPTGAGAETQWTPSTGANWENVDDATPDGDTTYNASNTVGQTDTYTMAGLTSASGLIYGVQKMEYARKDNAGTRSIAPVLRISGTDHVGVSSSLGASYGYVREIEEVSPASGVAFTIAEVNAMEVGVQVTA